MGHLIERSVSGWGSVASSYYNMGSIFPFEQLMLSLMGNNNIIVRYS